MKSNLVQINAMRVSWAEPGDAGERRTHLLCPPPVVPGADIALCLPSPAAVRGVQENRRLPRALPAWRGGQAGMLEISGLPDSLTISRTSSSL